jgi:hypothetical protein
MARRALRVGRNARGAGQEEAGGERQKKAPHVGGFQERHDVWGAPESAKEGTAGRPSDANIPRGHGYREIRNRRSFRLMNEPLDPNASEPPEVIAQRQAKRNLRRALIFGVVMATIEMGVLLYFTYC